MLYPITDLEFEEQCGLQNTGYLQCNMKTLKISLSLSLSLSLSTCISVAGDQVCWYSACQVYATCKLPPTHVYLGWAHGIQLENQR